MHRGHDEKALASVVGAIMILAILGMAIVYVNAYYVPRQGSNLEIQSRSEAQGALLEMSTRLSGGPVPFVQDLPLKASRGAPPLLEGIILSPIRADGNLVFDPNSARVTVSHNTTRDASSLDGVTRVDNADGATMRVYTLGSATAGRPLGALNLSVGGAYLEPATYRLVGGAVFVQRDATSTLIAPPSIHVGQTGTLTTVAWRIPILTGTLGEVGGRESAQVSLVPGPVAYAGSGQVVYNATISVTTTGALSLWREALATVVDCATCSVTDFPSATDPASGTVVAVIESATPGVASVSLDFSAVRYSLSVTERSAG